MTRGDKFDAFVKMYEESFKDHVLIAQSNPGNVPLVFLLSRPGTGMYHTWIAFMADRVLIFGDATVGGERGNGVISDLGYGLSWFTSDLEADYLCSKFLDKQWDEDHAEEWAREEHKDPKRGWHTKYVLNEILCDKAFGEFEFGEAWRAYAEDGDDWPSRDYPMAHAAMLVVIQRTFKRLYHDSLFSSLKETP